MKILIISDSHGQTQKIKDILQNYAHDSIVFLGDGLSDWEELNVKKPIYKVSGNCDFFSKEASEKSINIGGKNFFITHGHNFYVKTGLNKLLNHCKNDNFDFVLFGHTHEFFHETIDKMVFINPGTLISRNSKFSSFAMLEINGNTYLLKQIFF